MSPHCDDEKKYDVVKRVTARIEGMKARGETLIGQPIRDVVTVNGVRVTVATARGGWCALRPTSRSSSSSSKARRRKRRMREMFAEIDAILRQNPEVGAYNQTI